MTDKSQRLANLKKSLKADADSQEMIAYVKKNNSTDLTPTMRLTLYKILGYHLPYDETQNSFLDLIDRIKLI